MLHIAVHIICKCASVTKDFKRQPKRKQHTACIVLVVPTLLCGSKTCSLTKRSENEKQTTVRKFQRNLKVCTTRFIEVIHLDWIWDGRLSKSILSKHLKARRDNDKTCEQWSEGQTQLSGKPKKMNKTDLKI